MSSEERITVKSAAAEVLSGVTKAREVLAARLISLEYLWMKVDGRTKDEYLRETYKLGWAKENLDRCEEVLCRL